MTQLRKAFDGAVLAAERRSYIFGFLGRVNADTTITIVVQDRPGFFYVRVGGRGEPQSLTIAKNINKVPARAHLPVRMRREGGVLVIHDVDLEYIEASLAGQGMNPFGVPDHTHARGTGLDYVVEAQRMEPGLVQWSTGLTVSVEAFRYNVGAGWVTFLGDTLDLTDSVPTTVDKHRWVLVALDTATNTLTSVNGDLEDTSTPLTLDMLDDLDVTGMIPLGAIKIAFGDSGLSDYTKFFDARGWLNGALDLFSDAEGDSADVHNSTSADGTSDYAARRDHVHALDEMAESTIKGVPVGGGTVKPSDLTSAQVAAIVALANAFIKADGTVALTANWDIGDTFRIIADGIKARDAAGIRIEDKDGNLGIFVEDGGNVGFKNASNPSYALDILQPSGVQLILRAGQSGVSNGFTISSDGSLLSYSMLGNLVVGGKIEIQAGSSSGTQAAIGGVLFSGFTSTGNVGTGEDTLASYSIPANTLATNGDSLWFECWGVTAGLVSGVTVRVKFGATLLHARAITSTPQYHWKFVGTVVRTGAATQRSSTSDLGNNSLGTSNNTGLTETLSGAVTFAVTGEGTSNNDVVIHGLIIGWNPNNT